jgi:RNA polymerase sigma factor (sigma-70 family)
MSQNKTSQETPKASEASDEQIIASYKEGNQEAFKALIDRYTPALYNFTARIGNRNDASDIVQETFIKIWKHIYHFDAEKASFKTWIFTIARNTTTDYLRKKRSILFSDMEKENADAHNSWLDNIPDEELLPDTALDILQEKTKDAEFVNDILNSISPAYREILVLHYQEELTFDEIGKILDKPLNTVKSGHRRAIIELRKRLI